MAQVNAWWKQGATEIQPTATEAKTAQNSGDWWKQGATPVDPEPTSLARSVGDSAIALGTGVAQGVKMISDAAGAGNAVSRLIGKGIKAAEDLESDQRKAQKQERARTIKAAEDSGSTWEEVKAYAGSFADAPLDTTLNAVGSVVPTLAAAALTGGGSVAAQLAARAAPMAIGAVQGAGAVKGGIYDAVEQRHLDAGATPEQAAQRADVAQAYSGDNLGSIATGAGLGVLAGSTGAEAAVRRLAGGGAAKHAADESIKGIAKGAALGVAKEAPLEAVQGGQERLAANLAEQGEGFDTPTMRGVVGQAALEGLAAAPLGGGLGVVEASGRAGREASVNDAVDASPQAPSTAGGGLVAGTQEVAPQQAASMDGDAALPVGTPTDGQAQESTQQDQEQAAPAIVQEGAPAQVEPVEDVVQPTVQAAPIAPSAAMGINPEDGPLSAVAAQAVDSGTTDQLNAEALAQQVAQTSQQRNQPAPAQEGVDAETGEVSEQAREQQILERLDFLGQQGRATGWTQEAVTQRDALQQELDLLNPALRMEQLSSEADAADAQARDWASRNYKPNAKPLPEHAAQGGAADVSEANEQRRIKAIGEAKGRSKAARDELQAIQDKGNADAALAAKHDTKALRRKKTDELSTEELQVLAAELGPRHVRAKTLEKAIQTRADQAQTAINNGVNKDGSTALGNNGSQEGEQIAPQSAAAVQQIAREGSANRQAEQQRKLAASERWTRMTAVERQAAAGQAKGLNAVARANVHKRPWADLTEKNRAALLDVISPALVQSATKNKAVDVDIHANSGTDTVQAQSVASVDTSENAAEAGQDTGNEWATFSKETGTKGIPRAEMPQVPTQSHGGLVKHLNAQGIAHETTTVDAASLKPTQAEYSPTKVAKAKEATGDRAVIVSSDGHIIDGHHQAMAAAEDGKPVKAIVLDAPVNQALEAVKASPSVQKDAQEPASKGEFPVAEASASYSGISHSGGQRGKADAAEFEQFIATAREAAVAVAETDAQKAAVEKATESLRTEYIEAYRRLMNVRSSTYSAYVAGRSGLNAKQANRRNDALSRAQDAFSVWQKNSKDRVHSAALQARTDEQKQADRQAKVSAAADKAQRVEDADRKLIRKILAWKKGGDAVVIGKSAARVTGVNLGRDGYPSSVNLEPTDGSTLSDNKFDLADFFRRPGVSVPESKRRVRALVDAVRAEDAALMFRRGEPQSTGFDVQGFLGVMNQGQQAFSEKVRAQAVEEVQGMVDAIRKAWANGPDVVVAYDMADPAIPEAVRQADLQQRSGGASGEPEGFYHQGKVYLLASQLKTANDTGRVLFHEVLGHHGLRGAFGKELDGILNQIATMRKADVDAKILEYGLRDGNLQDRRIAAEEVLAEMAQNRPDAGFVKRAVAAIRTWLRKNVPGFKSLKLTDSEIINSYLLPARAWVERAAGNEKVPSDAVAGRATTAPTLGAASRTRESKEGTVQIMADRLGQDKAMLSRSVRKPEDFVSSPDGSLDFGEISPEMGKTMRRQAGKIRLQQGVQNEDGTGWGLEHIEANHGLQIRNAGFASVEAFVGHIARGFNEVLQAAKGGQLLVAVSTGRRDVMFVQLEVAQEGDFYRVNTAFPASRNYLEKQEGKGAKILWSGSEPRSAVAGQQPLYAGKPEKKSGQAAPIAQEENLGVAAKESPPNHRVSRTDAEASGRSGSHDSGDTSNLPKPQDVGKLHQQAEQGAGQGADDVMFSRSKLADLKDKGMKLAHNALSHPGKVSLWDRTVGTMRHVSERYPAFKPVFESAQQFIDDVSSVANQAAQVAPRLIPRVETLGDMLGKNRKRAISVGDNKAIGKALFGGTLDWGRDQHGKAMPMDDLRAKYQGLTVDQKAEVLLAAKKIDPRMMAAHRAKKLDQFETIINQKFESTILKAGAAFNHKELKEFFNLNDQQISLYDEARATVDKSLDISARAEMLRTLGRDWDGMRNIVMDAPTLTEAWQLLDDELEHRAKQYPDTRDRLATQMHQLSTTLSKAQELMDHGYMPLQRFGKYTLDVLDPNGERLYYGMFESKTDSHKMRQVMEREFPGAKITQGTMNEHKHKLMAGITPETAELFGSMLGLDAEGNQEKDKAFQEYLKLAKNNHSAMKRLIHRKGILGYSDDVGRVLASFVYSNARVAATGLNAGKMEVAINDLNTQHKEEGELGEIAAKLRSYIQDPQEEGQAIRGMLFA
ncbi:MAG: PLxRFG domain-containing protein [Comamonas sp.]